MPPGSPLPRTINHFERVYWLVTSTIRGRPGTVELPVTQACLARLMTWPSWGRCGCKRGAMAGSSILSRQHWNYSPESNMKTVAADSAGPDLLPAIRMDQHHYSPLKKRSGTRGLQAPAFGSTLPL